ncbi:hypothetical protein NDU88_007471 [Pleurodeles waltl]|uniref:Uncharacterized protein n=1 Tax=Pleurodeles waltl TaxID=8319 RepID=A0AAV7QKW7_PLEWA|nr:hypothetical protein NDU88_007471 [Pleurodeles waltl]
MALCPPHCRSRHHQKSLGGRPVCDVRRDASSGQCLIPPAADHEEIGKCAYNRQGCGAAPPVREGRPRDCLPVPARTGSQLQHAAEGGREITTAAAVPGPGAVPTSAGGPALSSGPGRMQPEINQGVDCIFSSGAAGSRAAACCHSACVETQRGHPTLISSVSAFSPF